MNSEALPLAVADMKTKLQDEVLGPLEQWLSAYRTIKVGSGGDWRGAGPTGAMAVCLPHHQGGEWG